MDQVTQQNAALVEEAAAAASSMQDQAAYLVEVAGLFKLDRSHSVRSHNHLAVVDGGSPISTMRAVPMNSDVVLPERQRADA